MQCGLLGKHLSHSFSPQIHSQLGDYPYKLYEVQPKNLGNFLKTETFTGINVTIPYKKEVIAFCDELSPTAALLGAVNTIVRRAGKLIGHNTDYRGFLSMLQRSGLCVSGKKVLILGSGGASATVAAALKELDANVVVISRSGENNYTNLHRHKDAAVIVNTTPVGMYPNNGVPPLDLDWFPALDGVLDLIYNPSRTALLLQAEERGLITENGLWMLVAQAKESAEWFTGRTINDSIISDIYKKLHTQTQNIILIGMPGCGKSTIGKQLAQKLQKKFVDADTEIETVANMTIPEIFRNKGESAFRMIETQVLSELGKQSGLVIATGGGCVTVPENYNHLHQNGYIICLERDLDSLPTAGRPLSNSQTLQTMYMQRKPLYRKFQDISIDNNRDTESTVNTILSHLDKGEVL